jgi:hypothetical protein
MRMRKTRGRKKRRRYWTPCRPCVSSLPSRCSWSLTGATNVQWLDTTDHTSASRRAVIYVMVKLAAASRRFPTSLYVHDIDIGQVRDPAKLGGHADIFRASHRGRPVAVKRLRVLMSRDPDMHKVCDFITISAPVPDGSIRTSAGRPSSGANSNIPLSSHSLELTTSPLLRLASYPSCRPG